MQRTIQIILGLFFIFQTAVCFAGTQSGTIVMNFDLSGHSPAEEAQLWIPYPVSDHYQEINKIKVDGDFSESAVYTDQKFQTPMLYARWPQNAKSRKLTFSFDVERKERQQNNLPEKESAWNSADHAMYLQPTRLGPIDGEVKKLADKITKDKHDVLAKAKAIYDWTVENTYRNPNTHGCGHGDVCTLLKDPGGKCSDISSIYVALSRAAGVPAREVFGIRQGKSEVTDITKWQHCWAEFYLPGHGWVPVDPADVRKMMLVHNLEINAPRTREYRDYFWGCIDPYRVKLGMGRDLQLNPPQLGQPVNYLMYPFAQIGSNTLDWLDPEKFKYTITHTGK